jgi:D-lyxose ketol-isomerase
MQDCQLLRPEARTFVSKPWGYEDWIFNDPKTNYCQKVLFIKGGKSGSIHMHNIKDEVLTCHSGVLIVQVLAAEPSTLAQAVGLGTSLITDTIAVQPGYAVRLKPGTWHKLSAQIDTTVYEASTAHSDEDVVRADTWKAVVTCNGDPD